MEKLCKLYVLYIVCADTQKRFGKHVGVGGNVLAGYVTVNKMPRLPYTRNLVWATTTQAFLNAVG